MEVQFEIDEQIDTSDIVFEDDDFVDGFTITRNSDEDISSIFRMRKPSINSIKEKKC